MRKGEGGGGKTEHKRHIHGNDVIPLREVLASTCLTPYKNY